MAIDKDLQERLVEQGQFAKLKELQDADKKRTKFLPELRKKGVVLAKKTKLFGTGLGESIGAALAVPAITKQQEEATQRNLELQDAIVETLRRVKDDPQKVRRLMQISQQIGNSNIIEQVPELQKTSRETFGDAFVLASMLALGFKPSTLSQKGITGTLASSKVRALSQLSKSIQTINAEERVRRFGSLGKLANKVIPIAREAAIGAGLLGGEAAVRGGDVRRQATTGALFGGGVTAGTQLAAASGTRLFQAVKPRIATAGRRALGKLQELATTSPKQQRIEAANTEVGKTLAVIPSRFETLKQRAAVQTLRGVEVVRQIPLRLINRFSPFERTQASLERLKGSPLTESEKVGRNARLTASKAAGGAEVAITELTNSFKKFDDIRDGVTAYLLKLDLIDRSRLGQLVATGESLADLQASLKRIELELGENLPRAQQAQKEYNIFNTSLLQERVDAGLISQKTMDDLLRTHPNYLPHNVVADIDERIANTFDLGQTLNVTKTDIKKAVGSTRELEDPIFATAQRTQVAKQLIEKNKTLRGLAEAQEEFDFVDGMRKLKVGEDVSATEGTISFFRKGEKETWAVPKDIEVAAKNLGAEQLNTILRLATIPARLLKAGATRFNLSFALPNKFRDKQTALLTADSFIESIAAKTNASPQTINQSKKELLILWKKSGGSGSSIFKEDGFGILGTRKPSAKVIADLERKGLMKTLDTINPVKIIEAVNESIENSTRLDVFKKALERGLTPEDAALVSRDATIDFQKMGTFMRSLNQVIPFLNARVQGFINLPRAFASSPETFARMQLYTSVYPTLALYQHNRQFESFANVSQYFKDNKWVVMVGEVDGFDSGGNPVKIPKFVTIPKGEGQQLVSSPIQFFLERADKRDFRTIGQMLVDTLGNTSPVPFQSFDSSNIFLTGLSQLGPIGTIPAGLGTNIQPFFGTKIIPESRLEATKELQFRRTTPESTKQLANILNVAPARLEFVFDSFGGLPQDIQEGLDILQSAAKGEGLGVQTLEDSPFGKATKIPVARTFLRESTEFGSPQQQHQQQIKEGFQTEIVSKKLLIKDKAEDIFLRMIKIKSKTEKKKFLDDLEAKGELTQEIIKKIKDIQKSRTKVLELTVRDSTDLRARVIFKFLRDSKEEGKAQSEIQKILDELADAKIITSAVKKKIKALQTASPL